MKLTFELEDPGNRPSQRQIAQLEKEIGRALPDDYKAFLIEHNGGYFLEPDDDSDYTLLFPLRSSRNKDDAFVRAFYSIQPDEADNDMSKSLKVFRKYHGMPNHLIPIADSDFGDWFVLSVGEDDFGSIYFMYHDSGESWESNRIQLAASFSGFIEGLVIEED